VAVFQCPSRRSAESYPANIQQFNCLPIQRAARSDYAMCAGDRFLVADVPKTALTKPWRAARDTGGVLFQASAVKLHKIVDGAAHTYLMGEKFVEPQFYRDLSVGELSGMWSYDWGVVRVASEDQAPWRDRNIGANGGAALGAFRFGSPHYGGWNMAFVDGTVRHIPFDLDPAVHARLGRRNDS
jgi:hypothetical protein